MYQYCQPSAPGSFSRASHLQLLIPSAFPHPASLRTTQGPGGGASRGREGRGGRQHIKISRLAPSSSSSGLRLYCSLNCLGKSNLAESLLYQGCTITNNRRGEGPWCTAIEENCPGSFLEHHHIQ